MCTASCRFLFLQLKNMIAALYSLRDGGTKDFRHGSGWDTIVRLYNGDLFQAKQGVSRRILGSYVVCDSWTRLNVLPTKIMQVNYWYVHSSLGKINVNGACVHYIQQPYMLAAIKDMTKYKDEVTRSCHPKTAEYLEACNNLFEKDILSQTLSSHRTPLCETFCLF